MTDGRGSSGERSSSTDEGRGVDEGAVAETRNGESSSGGVRRRDLLTRVGGAAAASSVLGTVVGRRDYRQPAAPTPLDGANVWPMAGYDHQNHFRNPHVEIPEHAPSYAWDHSLVGPNTLAVGPEHVFVGATGILTSLDRETGELAWNDVRNERVGERDGVNVQPVVADGQVFANRTRAVRGYDTTDGSVLMEATTNTEYVGFEAQPILAGGRLYALGGDVACFDGTGDLQWWCRTPAWFNEYHSPAFERGTLVGVSEHGGGSLWGFDATADPWQEFGDGRRGVPTERVKRWESGDGFDSALVTAGGWAFAARQLDTDRDSGDSLDENQVVAVSAETGDERWQWDAGSGGVDLTFLDGTLVAAVENGDRLVDLSPTTGNIRWEREAESTTSDYYTPSVVAGSDSLLLGRRSGIEHWTTDGPQWRLGADSAHALALTDQQLLAVVGRGQGRRVRAYEW